MSLLGLSCACVATLGMSAQVVAGLKGHIEREALLGSLVVAILNLKPAKLAGELSEAMLLAADAPGAGGRELVRTLMPPGAGGECCALPGVAACPLSGHGDAVRLLCWHLLRYAGSKSSVLQRAVLSPASIRGRHVHAAIQAWCMRCVTAAQCARAVADVQRGLKRVTPCTWTAAAQPSSTQRC